MRIKKWSEVPSQGCPCSSVDAFPGLTTEWERQANKSSDLYAKRGADMHSFLERHVDELGVLHSVAWQAARWAAEQEVLRARWERDDAPQPESTTVPDENRSFCFSGCSFTFGG